MKNLFKKYKSDNTGVMTMEFMVLLPILLMWFAGTFVFFDAFHKWMKSLKATYTISDLLSRQLSIDDQYLFDLDRIFDKLSFSRDPDNTWFRVTHLRYAGGALQLIWSTETKDQTSFTNAPGQMDGLAEIQQYIPTLVSGEYITLLQSYRPFNPLFDWVGLEGTTFTNTIAAPQRFTSELINDDHRDGVQASIEGYDPDETDEDLGVGPGPEPDV